LPPGWRGRLFCVADQVTHEDCVRRSNLALADEVVVVAAAPGEFEAPQTAFADGIETGEGKASGGDVAPGPSLTPPRLELNAARTSLQSRLRRDRMPAHGLHFR
jgi:hypothetical protein